MMKRSFPLIILVFVFYYSCGDSDNEADSPSETVDCAELPPDTTVCGCMDSVASNYDIQALYDDGSCYYCDTDTTFSKVMAGTAG